ncbi:Retrovirus-related Pol polyprotein from transposon RE2 [Araneus ventricosus]|uniref:Retrovirus-related Pol polyprotein from transposon RE2 n=1 Tax=Araneus ventricosus TaxID=182803 RepID=A0A4Y2WZY8_ARAVE|nr:Retrovirus-related Pol polyprotein from transposon RE2 [Araneus ventricosus]GBO42833.1 Retrovirus-related Pol polyprotein from transposon RE2 [Araneus ventricosus]
MPGKRGIMLGYARERRRYRIYDIEQKCVIEERAVKFNESVKGSKYLNNSPENLWEIDNLTLTSSILIKLKAKSVHLDSNPGSADAPLDEIISKIGRPLEGLSDLKEMKNANIVEIPKDYFEAQSNPNWPNWKTAMVDERKSLNKHKIWELVDKPDNTKIVKSKWVYTIKKDSKTPKFKARLVATGFNQAKNVDYLESYSPVVNIDTFRLLIALAAKLNLAVRQFLHQKSYLHSDLEEEEEVYMTAPPGYEMETEGKVYRLKKSINGLPHSGRNWYFKLKSELERIGLKDIASDNCVFVMINKNEFLVLCIYVDDIALFSNDIVLSNNVIRKLKTIFELKETTDGEKFLGIEVSRNENGFSLSQVEYINFLLEKYNMSLCNSVKTPMSKNEDKFFDSGNKFVIVTEFQTLIGELLYLANRTRPDISFAVTYLSQFCQKPEQKHFKLAKKILRYLKGTKEKTLVYSNKFGCISASSDASWGNAENGKSFSGSVLMLGDSLVIWKCNKQRSVYQLVRRKFVPLWKLLKTYCGQKMF